MSLNPIPEGYHSITPYLIIEGAAKAIDFYKNAFGATEAFRMQEPGSDKIGHAELKIGEMAAIKSHNPFVVNDIAFAREAGADMMAMNNYG